MNFHVVGENSNNGDLMAIAPPFFHPETLHNSLLIRRFICTPLTSLFGLSMLVGIGTILGC
jgi:hypothetical protein